MHHSFILCFDSMNIEDLKREPHKTVLLICIVFLLVHIVTEREWSIYVSFIVGALGLLSNSIARIVNNFWIRIALVLNWVMQNLLLSVIFYIILTPIAILSKIYGSKNQLMIENTKQSMFKPKDTKYNRESFGKPW